MRSPDGKIIIEKEKVSVPELFEKTWIKSLELDNRAVRSATWSGVCDPKGYITEKALEFYGNLAEGGIGLIVTGFQYVMPNSIAMPFQMGNYRDDQLEGLSRLVETIHSRGGKVAAQLVHTGSKANPELLFQEAEVWGSSAVLDPLSGQVPKEMTQSDITSCIEAFASAAARSQKAGFDAIQLHGAHGYGINQFLSGFFNRRSDKYGGAIAKRYLFLAEVMEAVRGAVGKDYPVFIKLSGNDYFENGLTTEESLYVARRLVEDGIDCIEVSAGSRACANGMVPSRPNIRTEKDEAYLGPFGGSIQTGGNSPDHHSGRHPIAQGDFKNSERRHCGLCSHVSPVHSRAAPYQPLEERRSEKIQVHLLQWMLRNRASRLGR